MSKTPESRAREPEELIFRTSYAVVDLSAMLASAERRGRIRRLPIPQLFFSAQELEPSDLQKLLPHITRQQWTGILDLALWSRDEVAGDEFLRWEKEWLTAEDAVARKLIAATDADLWELFFRRELGIHARTGQDEFEPGELERECLETPDGNFLLALPQDAERRRLVREIMLRLYQLEPEWAALHLASALARTSIELEESAYQNRRRRVEDLGFQDYFEATEIYRYLAPGEKIPPKQPALREVSLLPAPRLERAPGDLLLLAALARVDDPAERQALAEELCFVANKVLSANARSPARPERVKTAIRKALAGMNLGLEFWCEGDPGRAVEGVRLHYLESFFQIGYSRLLDLSREAAALPRAEAGSFEEAFLEGLARRPPLLAEETEKGIVLRFFSRMADLEAARAVMERIGKGSGRAP